MPADIDLHAAAGTCSNGCPAIAYKTVGQCCHSLDESWQQHHIQPAGLEFKAHRQHIDAERCCKHEHGAIVHHEWHLQHMINS